MQIRAIYVQHTSQIVLDTYTTYHIRTRKYTHVYARICTYLTTKEPYVGLTGAVCECISNEYVQILTPCWGHRLNVFERICTYLFENTYIYVQYVYVRICNYTCIYVLHVYARIFCIITCIYVLHVYARIFIETSNSRPDPASSFLHKPSSSTHAAVSVFHSKQAPLRCSQINQTQCSPQQEQPRQQQQPRQQEQPHQPEQPERLQRVARRHRHPPASCRGRPLHRLHGP